MDFHAAMETFAEAWVAANTQTVVNTDPQLQTLKPTTTELPTLLPKEQLPENRLSSGANNMRVDKTPSPKKPDHPPSAAGGSTKSLPIHCLIEQISGTPSFDNVTSAACSQSSVELDSFAILPSSTLLSDLVRAALMKLGYSSANAMNAKGAIQIKNWKPLTFDSITDNPQAVIDDILGELTNVATLRIRLASQPKLSSTEEVKDKLLQLLVTQSQSLLNDSGCPIEKPLLASLTKGENLTAISDDMRHAFDRWYSEQLRRNHRETQEKSPEPAKPPEPPKDISPPAKPESKESLQTTPHTFFSHSRTRIRTSFDPEHEIPRLQQWFQESQHPSREQMIRFMNELNLLDSRKGRRPLDLTNIIYWFKNARAAQRRASKAIDDSFENEENTDVTSHPSQIPYLPNKNAVYVIPFPYHQQMMGQETTHVEEPCDLSINKKRESSLDSPVEKPLQTLDNNYEEKKPVSQNGNFQIESFGHESKIEGSTDQSLTESDIQVEKVNQRENGHENGNGIGIPKNCKDVEQRKDVPTNVSKDFRQEEEMDQDDDDAEDDDEYDDSSDDNSDQSLDSEGEHRQQIKRERDDTQEFRLSVMPTCTSAPNMTAASVAALSLAQMSQPLHIPQLPPPLAMAYYPMNSPYYNPQANPLSRTPHTNSHKHEPRKRRTRVFIDPLTEIPKLEKWFMEDTHPSAYMIDKYCEELNRSDYRQKFPRLEPKNVQLWFKNHRAKVKRMRLST